MKLLERTEDRLLFSLGAREKTLLEQLLAWFPLDPDPLPTISREGNHSLAEAEALLRESVRDQKRELATWIKRRLCEGETLVRSGAGWRLGLDGAEAERLLQVLNELRVAAWVKLGRPEDLGFGDHAISPDIARHHAIMVLAGQFEIVFIHALHGEWGGGYSEAK